MARVKNLERLSSLSCRANGFLLGCFQVLIRYGFARAEFPQARRRMVDFLEEIDVALDVPRSHGAYRRTADQLMMRIFEATAARSPELGDFTFAGAASCIDASMRLAGTVPSDDLRDAVVERLGRQGLDGARLYERFLADVRVARDEGPAREVRIQTFLTPALSLLEKAVQPLPTDERTCFVAMPFAPPFSRYFARVYRPFARELGCAAFRMWGGLSGEAYVDLMLAVIRRCGVVVADLSGLNPNVVYEVGVARGLDKKVLLLCQRAGVDRVPANVGSDQLLLGYSPRERDWPAGTVLRLAAQASLLDFTRDLAERRLARATRAAGQPLPELPAADELALPAKPGATARADATA